VSLMWMYWSEVRPMDAARELKRLKRADLLE
jgi:hypothetical protein